jgi:hypothetical protein
MFFQTKNRGTAFCFVTAYPFEDTRTIVQYMGHDVDASVVPLYEFTVFPNFLRNAWSLDIPGSIVL